MEIEITGNRLQRLIRDWSQYANEPIEIQASTLSEPVYGFGSELGCLRIFHKYKCTGDSKRPNPVEIKVAYSENLNRWYVVLYPSLKEN